MLLRIEPDGPVPIYQQIRDRIVEAIATGEAPVGSGLPTTRQLAVDLGINFHTVNKGYDQLRQEGLLRIGRKAGSVVQRDATSGPPRPGWEDEWATRLRTMLAEATAQGLPAEDVIRHCQDIVAGFATPVPDEDPT
jgi:DNA-binding transcriptional regulator YhcF (GntR family)